MFIRNGTVSRWNHGWTWMNADSEIARGNVSCWQMRRSDFCSTGFQPVPSRWARVKNPCYSAAIIFCVMLPTVCAAQTRPVGEIRRGIEIPTTDRAERQQAILEQIARRIEPSLVGDASRLPAYVDFFKRESVRDPRIFAA